MKQQHLQHKLNQLPVMCAMSNQSRIRLERVTKRWDASAAVDNISFDVTPGQFVILLGPSGCGKSITLRMIAGLEEASGGHIYIGERDD